MIITASIAVLIRKKSSLKLLRANCVIFYLLFFYLWFLLSQSINTITDSQDLWAYMNGGDKKADKIAATFWMLDFLRPAATLLLFVVFTHIVLWRRKFLNLYNGEQVETDAVGDKIFEDVRSHGPDPQWRKSFISSGSLHIFVLIILPFLINLFGCVEAYKIPFGKGSPAVMIVSVVKPKKKKRKKLIFNPNSAISFKIPKIEDSELLKEVQEMTEAVYKANTKASKGKLGEGGGDEGGWPDGAKDAIFRFIRLKHGGRGFAYGMGDTGGNADRNFMKRFKDLTGFKVKRNSELINIRLIPKFPKGFAPPFVYITGTRISISSKEIDILRKYVINGGMIFADAGSRSFDSSWRGIARRLNLGPLRNIDNHDPIFMQPFELENGTFTNVPHGGRYAQGIKHRGRWVVFYFPGDLKDAWKDDASGFKKNVVEMSYKMGINIIHYSFTQYLKATRKLRKR